MGQFYIRDMFICVHEMYIMKTNKTIHFGTDIELDCFKIDKYRIALQYTYTSKTPAKHLLHVIKNLF